MGAAFITGKSFYTPVTGDIGISMMHGARFMQDSSLHPPKKIKQSRNPATLGLKETQIPLISAAHAQEIRVLPDLRKMFAPTFADPSVSPFGWIFAQIL